MKTLNLQSPAETSPSRWYAAVLCLLWIIVGEGIVMTVLPTLLPDAEVWVEALVDALLLGLLCVPGIWITIVAPVHRANRRSLLFSQSVLNSTPDGVVTIDRSGTIRAANDQACEQFGYASEEMIGSPVTMLMDSSLGEEHQSFIDRYIQTGESKIIGVPLGRRPRLEALRKDGSRFPLDLSVSELKLDGESYFTGILQDLTELDAARLLAEAGSQAKGDFLANMSHEIRTPLNGILGFVELMLDDDPSPRHRELLHIVHSSGETLLAILNDILDYSRIESGKLEIEAIPFDLRDLLETTADLFAARAHEKGLEFLCAPSFPAEMWVLGDPTRMRQVLSNFLSNAIKFTSEGEIELGASATFHEDGDGVDIEITVCDSGIGIPSERMDRLFKEFSQVDASTARQFGGTGLGLAISMRLVQLMGGEVGVSSTEGSGSTFSITLELREAEPMASADPGKLANLAGKRVLVVDDHPANLRLVSELLEQVGCRITCTRGAAEALQLLTGEGDGQARFDFALLDAMMPVVDGLTLAKKIIGLELAHQPHLLLLSSIGKVDFDPHDTRLFDAILHKPIKKKALIGAMLSSIGLEPETVPKARATQRRLAGLHLLLAEDNPVNRRLALAIIEREGATLGLADDGLKAVELWQENEFDLILMDLQMPEMDGITATHVIRSEDGKRGRTPILAMTACALEEDKLRCLKAGMDGYIAKPFKADKLVASILALCGDAARKCP